jgi:hypothetical protein
MSDHNRQYDLDDELLSAYIDDELSAEERAAVEARLATDPAAQQLLHELRSVSQSVQAVPTEKLGRDLSDSVIAAITAKKADADGGVVRGSPDPAPASDRRSPSTTEKETFGEATGELRPAPSDSSDDTMPKLRIFGSKRAFVWAAMALAAGLLIMIFQSDDNSKKLPPVAATNRGEARNEPVDEIGRQPRREIALSAAPKSEAAKPVPASPPSADGLARNELEEKPSAPAAEPTGSATRLETSGRLSGSHDDGAAARAPASPPAVNAPIAASSPAVRMRTEDDKAVSRLRDDVSAVADQPKPSQAPAEKSSPALQPLSSGRAHGGALGIADAMRKSETRADSAAQPFVLVRVIAKPEAIKSGSFDRVLAANNISFVSEPNAKQPVAVGGGRVLKEIKSESAEKPNKSAESRTTDAVLVEAPPATIEMCLSDLNKNPSDFLSIAVSEPPNAADRFNGKAAPAKKAADATRNFSQFSRGLVPQADKDSFRLYEYYYGFNSPVLAPEGQPRSGGDGGGIGGRTKSVNASGGEAAPTVAGQAGPGFRGGPKPGGTVASGADHDTNDGDSLYFKEGQLPEVRRARRIESARFDASASASQSQSLAARAQSESEALKKPASQRVPAEVAEPKADATNDNLRVLFVFTPEVTSASSAPAANPSK